MVDSRYGGRAHCFNFGCVIGLKKESPVGCAWSLQLEMIELFLPLKRGEFTVGRLLATLGAPSRS